MRTRLVVACILVIGVAGLLLGLYFNSGAQWRRIEARSGSIGLLEPGRNFNFSLAMPSNWEIDEWFPHDYRAMPAGDLLGWDEARGGSFRVTFQAFTPGQGESPIARFENRHRVWREGVEGVEVTFFEPLAYADEPGLMTGAIFPNLPAAPSGTDALGLKVYLHRPTMDQAQLVEKVIRSVRYAPPPERPDAYEPRVKPGTDWTRVKAGTDGRGPFNFSLLLPPGWTTVNSTGIDNVVGTIEGDGIRFGYGFGNTIGRLPTGDAQVLWYEVIAGEIVHFVRPSGTFRS